MPTDSPDRVSDLEALEIRQQNIASRIAELEAVVSNPASGQIVISKARVELAQLHESVKRTGVSTKDKKELANIKEDAIASKLKGKLEYALLKAKEDKVRYELDIHAQLSELLQHAIDQQYNAQQRTNKAKHLSTDAQSSLEAAQLALEEAQRTLNDANSLNVQRTQNLDRLIKVEATQDKEVGRLHEETTKNEVLIEKKLIKAGLSKKELALIFENNKIGVFKEPHARDNSVNGKGGKSGVGDKLRDKSKALKDKAAAKKKGAGVGESADPDEYQSSTPQPIPNINTNEFVQKLDKHRIHQDENLKGLQTEVEKLNDKCSKAQWAELIKLRAHNARIEDELDSQVEWLALSNAKIDTLQATCAHQKTNISDLESEVQSRDIRIRDLEDKNTKQRERIVNLEDATSGGISTIKLLEGRVSTLESDVDTKKQEISELDDTCTEQRGTIQQLQNDTLHQKNTIKVLDLQREKLEGGCESLQMEVFQLEETNKSQKDRIGMLENAASGGMTAITMLEERVTKLDTENSTKQNRIKELEEKNTSQRERIVSLENATSGGMETLRTLETNLTSIKSDNEAKSTKIQDLETTKATQEERITTLENDTLHQKNTIRVLDLQRESLENACESKENRLQELEGETSTQKERICSLENATSGGMETLRVLESKILDLNAEDERKSKDIMELDETCTQQRAKIEMLDGSGTQHREMIQEFEMQVQSLTTDNETQATKIAEFETTNTAQHEQIQSMEKDAARVSDIIKFLEVRVSCLDKDVHSKENKINDLEALAYRQKERIDMLENDNLHLKNTVKYLELQGQSIEEKIASLDANLAEIKVNVVHWHRLTSVMRHELDIVQEKRDLEERNLHRLQRRLKHEEGTLQVTKDAILSLDKMKVLLDYRMMVENEETQKKQLSAMRVDTVMLLKDKSRALKAIQSVKSSYDTAISDKREILFLHHLLEHVHETLLEWQNGMNSSIWAPSEILLACVDHESKADAVRKTQQLRFRTLMDTKKRGSTASGARISDMEPGDTSDDDSGGPSSEEIIVLKRKLAEITAEKEEFKRRAKSEMYQLSCRECVDCELRFVGKTWKRLWSRVDEHFDEIWDVRDQLCQPCTPEAEDEDGNPVDDTATGQPHWGTFSKTPLAAHLAIHCKDAETKEDALEMFHKTVRVERRTVLKRTQNSSKKIKKIFKWII